MSLTSIWEYIRYLWITENLVLAIALIALGWGLVVVIGRIVDTIRYSKWMTKYILRREEKKKKVSGEGEKND